MYSNMTYIFNALQTGIKIQSEAHKSSHLEIAFCFYSRQLGLNKTLGLLNFTARQYIFSVYSSQDKITNATFVCEPPAKFKQARIYQLVWISIDRA